MTPETCPVGLMHRRGHPGMGGATHRLRATTSSNGD